MASCEKCKASVENRGNDCVVQHQGRWLCYPCVVAELEAENEQLRGTLRELYDFQNGCPLPKYKVHWEAAMAKAKAVLAAMESEPPECHDGVDITEANEEGDEDHH